jgi:hypothetical protein
VPFWDDCNEQFQKALLCVIKFVIFFVETWSRSSVVVAGKLKRAFSQCGFDNRLIYFMCMQGGELALAFDSPIRHGAACSHIVSCALVIPLHMPNGPTSAREEGLCWEVPQRLFGFSV